MVVHQAVTYAVPDFQESGAEALEWWWILLAVIGGLALLILIIFILYKVCAQAYKGLWHRWK